ncbi:hypothetical protein cypCar_00023269 [Cyprinus carpio]|nr:hypothetical protein cypCar_00023269 [Cyprinus carpio]
MSCSLHTSSCLSPKSMLSKSIVTPIRCGTITPCGPKAYSVYGCGFGGSTRISSSRVGCYPNLRCKIGGGDVCYGKPNSGGFRITLGNCDYIQLNEKCTMQNLNDRLASYLEKVRSLEAANANLERQIREYYEKKGPICQRDYSCYWNTINCLKEKDVAALLCQLADTKVCVEVDAAPQQDLNKVLEEIRCHYENIIDKHRREQECWFKEKTGQLCKDVASNTECLETSRSQISDLRRTLQCLEIELQSQISMKRALECSLLETEARYSTMLAGFQKHIDAYEAELCQVRSGIEQQGRDYAALLDIKSRLEQEIATYRCLLEKLDIKTQEQDGVFVCVTPADTMFSCKQVI